MAIGKIVQLKNNYGLITTDSYQLENEWIPFEITRNMIEERDGKQYIKYTDDIQFKLTQSQGIRNRDIKVASDVVFVGNEWKYYERKIENNYCQIVRNRFSEYAFYYPNLSDERFIKWLKKNDFEPRMLEYLSQGIFTKKNLLEMKNIKVNNFNIKLLFGIDKIDIEFRKYILSWIVGIENSFKSYFTQISISDEGKVIWKKIISDWSSKKPKIKKLIKRARDKKRYRIESEEFDYLSNECEVPILDFMEQLELNELTELIDLFYHEYSTKESIPDTLNKMKECILFIGDLCAIRNAAAHGRSILPDFMDPDYNGNWDFEFDNIDERSNVDNWLLYNPLKRKWNKVGLGEFDKQIINTIYGNPLRRAWVELNYMYFYIVSGIEKKSFDLFKTEARLFLIKDDNRWEQLKDVNLCNMRLSDMGNTTLGVSSAPYDEIAREAFAVWEVFNVYY